MYTASEFNLKKMRREIEEVVDLVEQEKLKNLFRPSVEAAVGLLNEQIESIKTEFRRSYHLRTLKETKENPFTIRSEYVWSQIAYVSAGATMVQDALVSGTLAESWLNINSTAAVMAGVVAGIILSFGWKFGVGLLANAFTRDAVRRARRALKGMTAGAFAINFLLVLVVLATRNPSDSWVEFLANLSNLSLTFMGVALPVLAGALLAIAHDLHWSKSDTDDFQSLVMRAAELTGFLAWCNSLISDINQPHARDELHAEPTL